MNQPLRITFASTDYTFTVINPPLIDKQTTEITVSLDGEEVKLVRDSTNEWIPEESSSGFSPELLAAVGRAIRLRYRI